jgi:hypothetical protein
MGGGIGIRGVYFTQRRKRWVCFWRTWSVLRGGRKRLGLRGLTRFVASDVGAGNRR